MNPRLLKALRTLKGLSQGSMAMKLEISQPSYARIERGQRRAKKGERIIIIETLGQGAEAAFEVNYADSTST